MRIILTRHGETDWNVKGLMQGQKQSKLTERGVKQAKALADRLKDEDINVIYTSEMHRSIDTAKDINRFHDLRIVKTKLLNEIRQGIFEGKKGELMYEEYPNRDKELDFRPPKAESIKDVEKRLEQFLKKLPDKNILIVAHKGANKILLTILLKKPLKDWVKIKQDHTCINIISIKDKKAKLELFNNTDHLKNIKKLKEQKGLY